MASQNVSSGWAGSVNELDGSYFQASGALYGEIFNGKAVILVFYSPGCGWCQKLKPTFNQAAEANTNTDLMYAVVNASSNRQLMAGTRNWPYKVNGYPTIVGYYNNQYVGIYSGDRSTNSLQEFGEKLLSSASKIGGGNAGGNSGGNKKPTKPTVESKYIAQVYRFCPQ